MLYINNIKNKTEQNLQNYYIRLEVNINQRYLLLK